MEKSKLIGRIFAIVLVCLVIGETFAGIGVAVPASDKGLSLQLALATDRGDSSASYGSHSGRVVETPEEVSVSEPLSYSSLLGDLGQDQIAGTKIPLTKDQLNQLEEFVNGIDDETAKQRAQSILKQVITTDGEVDIQALKDVIEENNELISGEADYESEAEIFGLEGPPSLEPVSALSVGTSTVFEPASTGSAHPYTSCHSWGEKLNLQDDYACSCSAEAGGIGAYAYAWIGGATAEALQQVNFYIGRTKTLTVDADIIYLGGAETFGVSAFAETWQTCYIDYRDKDHYYHWTVDPWWAWDEIVKKVISIVLSLVGGVFTTIKDAILAVRLINTAKGFYDIIQADDKHKITHLTKTYTFSPGYHSVWVGMRGNTGACLLGFGKATILGQVIMITIDGIAPPQTPIVGGPNIGDTGRSYDFSAASDDPNGDDVRYLYQWGDGQTSDWTGFFSSGGVARLTHAYSKPGEYEIRVRASDRDMMESLQPGTFTVCINGLWENDPANPCRERRLTCSGSYEYRNKADGTTCGTDYYDDWVFYCNGDQVWKHRQFHDFYCVAGACADHMRWVDEQLVQNCNANDGWYCNGGLREYRDYHCSGTSCSYAVTSSENCNNYDGWVDTGNTRWVADPGNGCQEKEQKEQQYRDYTCSGASCTYSIANTQWIDTGNKRNKGEGTICGYGVWEPDPANSCKERRLVNKCSAGSCASSGTYEYSNMDINGDEGVNVLDMVLTGQHWGQTGSPGWIPEDVTKDGVINVLDMVMIGQHWTG